MLLENPYIPLLTHPILQEEEAATRLKLKAQEIEQFDRVENGLLPASAQATSSTSSSSSASSSSSTSTSSSSSSSSSSSAPTATTTPSLGETRELRAYWVVC